MHILVINGPNLGALGTREPDIYGTDTLADLEVQWHARAGRSDASLDAFQSNHEGAIIDAIHDARDEYDGLVINAGALTHYSYSLRDAVVASDIPAVEVHISNVHEREKWRHFSVLTDVCDLTIVGRGPEGYLHAIDHLVATDAIPPLTMAYGTHASAVADLRTPRGDGPHPTALLIHGGFWRNEWQRDLMDPMAVALAERGWATVNIEYSRGLGSYASAVADLQDAVGWVHGIADDHSLDPGALIAVGHSAGGYLGLRLAHDGLPITGVAPLGSVTDLAAMSALRPDNDPVAFFLGGSVDEFPRLWDQAELHGKPTVPVHLLHGLQDDVVPSVDAETYAAANSALGTATVIPNCGHMDIIDPGSESWSTILEALEGMRS